MLVSLLLLFFVSSQATNWYYLHNVNLAEEEQNLYATGCYQGTYGPITLLSCNNYANTTFLKELPNLVKLCVIKTTDATFLPVNEPESVIHQLEDYYVIIPTCVSECVEDQNKIFAMKVFAKPLVPLTASRDKYISVKGMDPDPLIAEVLEEVHGEAMMKFVTELSNFYTRNSRAYGAVQAEEYLVEHYTDFGLWTTVFPFQTNYSSCVVAEKTGTVYPDEIIVVGAHYDSRATRNVATELAPGANDDASGSSILLELARVIQHFDLSFERTLRLVAFSGEEQGLVGSGYYAQDLASNGVDVVAMFNGDMLGWKPAGSANALGMKRDYVDNQLLQSANEITNLYVPELGIGLSTSCCSDYVSFYEVGYSAIGYFQFPGRAADYPYYHTSNDVPEHMDINLLELEGKAMIAAVLTYAGVHQTKK